VIFCICAVLSVVSRCGSILFDRRGGENSSVRRGGSNGVESVPVGRRWETDRTEAFSDGVFAIAITLLVLEIGVPESEFHDLWRGILHEWPAYLGYATSFITIGGIWLAHHGIFARLEYANARIMQINLLLLMAVSFLPYPTRLVADAFRDPDAERVAVTFYGASLLAVTLLFSALWGVVARDRELLKPEVDDEEVMAILRAATPSIGFYIGATALAIVAPRASVFLYLGVAVLNVLRARGDEPGRKASPA
jgi:TMEM175 potassium channel family protein